MLKGQLIGLRAVEKEDLLQLMEWRNCPEYRKYFREYRELSYEHQTNWFNRVVVGDSNQIMFSIIELQSKRLLGACGLCYIDWINRNADFSIYIGADDLYIDDNFAYDAAMVMIKYGFQELNLHRLWAEIYDFDERKKKMFTALGFSLDGTFRDNHWAEGEWHDSLFYSLLSEDTTVMFEKNTGTVSQ